MKRTMLLTLLVLATSGGPSTLRADGDKEAPAVARPAKDLVADLDAMIQARFQTVRDEDIRKGRLGASRIIDLRSPHGLAFKPENKEEQKAVEKLRTAGWRSALFVGGAGRLGNLRGDLTGPVFAQEFTFTTPGDKAPLRDLAKRAIAETATQQSSIDDLVLEARPVVAASAMCLNCHQGKKVGDALGAVVYAFSRACRDMPATDAE